MNAIIEHQRGIIDLRAYNERRRATDMRSDGQPERRKQIRRALISKMEMQCLLRGGE